MMLINNRVFFLALLLFCCEQSIAQKYLEVFAIDCRTNEERKLNEIEIFHNNHSFSLWHPDGMSEAYDGFRIYDDYKEGVYFIEYKSIYGRIERIKFNFTKDNKQKVSLCVDKINHKKQNHHSIIEQLNDGEKYIIQNTYHGSFDYGVELIEIKRNHGMYFAKFKNRKRMISKKLSDKEVKLFNNFEIELNLVKTRRQYSSWQNHFVLSYKGNNTEITDSNGHWNGWGYLLRKLGFRAFE